MSPRSWVQAASQGAAKMKECCSLALRTSGRTRPARFPNGRGAVRAATGPCCGPGFLHGLAIASLRLRPTATACPGVDIAYPASCSRPGVSHVPTVRTMAEMHAERRDYVAKIFQWPNPADFSYRTALVTFENLGDQSQWALESASVSKCRDLLATARRTHGISSLPLRTIPSPCLLANLGRMTFPPSRDTP